MAADSALPAYRNKILQDGRATRGDSDRRADDLFFHLGYWPDPSVARHDFDELKAAQRRLNDRLLELAQLRSGLRVLDVGCGLGGTLSAIDDRHSAMDLIGLNIDRAQLEIARGSVRGGSRNTCAWVAGDACALPFPAASFDRILALECAFHFRSRLDFFVEAARIMRPGGCLAMSDFVTSASLRDVCPPDVGAEIQASVGPWPSFWDDAANPATVAQTAGFSLVLEENASLATLPSYRCFLSSPPIEDPQEAIQPDPIDRAMALMEWLQRKGLLNMTFLILAR